MRRILIATENSPCSHEAVHRFMQVLGGSPAEVYALTVVPRVTGDHTIEQAEAAYKASLEAGEAAIDTAALETAAGGLRLHVLHRLGAPAETIVQVAQEIGADLIVLGTHGQDAPRLAGGSVAEAVLHEAPCGVVIFPWHAKVGAPA